MQHILTKFFYVVFDSHDVGKLVMRICE